ncbi:NAD(P)-dependent dehydrogenase (short-subunit alcohol dehydrogenase family) [Paenibacillus rhizosphaerae]|uniref:NAD(P)-dependent dehydrogenase (Short-subunit alcohol dehydrogenase family) n=1 Tax=Paenibacillus rhizosphaerae TaxID=297318 RepID=A0A839TXB5_9BACL|nr:SDR family oxidoreductase [Paenibacillus rhizosphaerae]MBB3129909.1 NAD(P)-dependent dehydrogenase (short-subunit alcohol dehydrogenase family) [Paenibacillus rhizosphaerae]
MSKTILITGTSSGLGKLTAIHFAKMGWNVAATMRSPEKETELTAYSNIQLFRLDVTDVEQVQTAVKQAIEAFGTIDVVVNNAGMGAYGALELAEEQAIDWQFAVNVRGPINVIRAVLPHFRANGGGMFINISSYMGVTSAVPLGSLYNMSKFALEGLTEGLYYELKPLNIELRLVEQGGSSGNNFINNVVWSTNPDIQDYDRLTAQMKNLFEQAGGADLDDPQTIVGVISDLATGKSTQFRTLVGDEAHELVRLRQSVPIEEFLETMRKPFM